jgi:glycosyltransferase involved in cell wall biosynthesis
MIIKNEKANLPTLLDQVCPVLEEVVLVDTGSTDGTLDIIRNYQSRYENIKLDHFTWVDDFSAARNFSFSLATKEWLFWLDGDDQINTEDLKKFKNSCLLDSNIDVWVLDYVYSRFENGSPQTILGRERFLKRSLNPRWLGAIHESIPFWAYKSKHNFDLKINHNRAGKALDLNRNVRILEKEYLKNPNDARTAYYYGKELFDRIDPRGIEVLEKYLDVPGKYWDDEVNARSRLAFHYLSIKNHGKAINVINPVYHLDITRRRAEFYYVYGQTEFDLQNWEVSLFWFKFCTLEAPPPPRVLNLEYFTWKPLRKIAECYKKLGKIQETYEYADRALSHSPNDSSTKAWYADVTSFEFGSSPKKIIEFSEPFFETSKVIGEGPEANFKINVDKCVIPFANNTLDGAVVRTSLVEKLKSKYLSLILNLCEKTKPRGFLLWVFDSSDFCPMQDIASLGYSYLVDNVFKNKKVRLFVKSDGCLEKVSALAGPYEAGPWRIRICNFIRSAVLAGHYANYDVSDNYDVVITRSWSDALSKKVKTRVFDICEKLDSYDSRCFDWATVVNVCSDNLAEHVKKFTDKKIIVVEDSAEMSEQEWFNLCV